MSAASNQQVTQAIHQGRDALERGDLVAACQHLGGIEHPEALFLLALAARQLGQAVPAEVAFRRALELEPDFVRAGTGLGRLLIDLQRFDDALPVYEDMLRHHPQNLPARFGHATAQLGVGQCEQAEACFDALIHEGNDRPEIRFMRGRARLELGRVDEGIADLQDTHRREPSDYSLKALAATLWMRDEQNAFQKLVGTASMDPSLVVTAAELLRQSGRPQEAISAITAATAKHALPADAFAVTTQAYLDLGDATTAARVASEGLAVDPDERGIKANLISALLMQGKADDALAIIGPMRQMEPNGQHWIAYEATALRLQGDDRYGELVDLERFVRAYTLPLPDGFESIESFNDALLQALDRWQQYERHPLDQSLRDGSQTPRDLTGIDDPVIKAYVGALDKPIRDYMEFVGSGESHPLTARNTGGYRIAGSWSVRLHGGGRHVNHVHPEGWISSAYYVAVPPEVDDETRKSGWIKFGEPPFETDPATPAEKWVKPSAGMLVLFPSFLWHGTTAISDNATRVTAPFDVVPA